MSIPPELCARCKGFKRLCKLPRCPILESFQAQVRTYMRLRGLDAHGSTPPSILVGEFGYPKVKIYYMVPVGVFGDNARLYEDPVGWSIRGESLANIIKFRSELLSGEVQVSIDKPEILYEKEFGLAGLSVDPVDSEVKLAKPPIPTLRFDGLTKPLGPRAPANTIKITSNPKIPLQVEKIIWDDLKAVEAIRDLYFNNVDIYTIQRLLSLGFLGRIHRRRIVPTRWSITAVDDTISRILRSKLRGRPEVQESELYYNEYLGNRFLILVKPGPGRFEWIEIWQPRSFWVRSSSKPIIWRVEENTRGEATAMDGGFSAARLAVLEVLSRVDRIGDTIIIREITPGYYAPVGNWHIRETVRRALAKPIAKNITIKELKDVIKTKIDYNHEDLISRIRLLRNEVKLTDYT
ncbi:MAG: Nre family DNA repair protein [Acidilobaceae archaeon]